MDLLLMISYSFRLMNIQEVSKTMRELAREMERAGFIEDVVEDTFASMEPEGLQTEADAEVDRILHEITSDIFAKASDAPTAKVASNVKSTPVAAVEEPEEVAEDDEFRAMQSRLQSL
jgi:charged multivesicular body protein 3